MTRVNHQIELCSLSRRSRQSGLGIIEVLIALVIVSLGVLGMASLQLTGMQHSTGGLNRSKALLYAENMAARMRVNRDGAQADAYASLDSATVNCGTQPAPYCQAHPGGTGAQCSLGELATFDFHVVSCGDWGSGGAQDGVVGGLPNGAITVNCDDATCTPTSTHTISVTWVEGQIATTDRDDVVTRRVQIRLQP
ncbi:MAG: type IV pilus modification protein PilV [Gammaproteobacteria bacterium]|nr:type IV pilus modification protein PilV [Gammaproteobacteria bacterium]